MFKSTTRYAPKFSKNRGSKGPYQDRKSTRLNSSHLVISYAVFCLKKKTIRLALPSPFLLEHALAVPGRPSYPPPVESSTGINLFSRSTDHHMRPVARRPAQSTLRP